MTSKFDEEKPVLPKEHWVCQNCSATSNLIRSHDISKPTFCKPCMISLRENLKYAFHDRGVKFMLESIINILEKEFSYSQKKYIVRHINSVLEDRLEDWKEEK